MCLLENTGKYLCDCENPSGFSGANTSERNVSQVEAAVWCPIWN